MNLKNLTILASAIALTAAANAQPITSFVNLDFDSGIATTPGPFKGFDAPAAPEIDGWVNNGVIDDGGVEGPSSWWIADDYAHDKAGFINPGGSAYNLSDYTIQSGDVFSVSFLAQWWQWTGANGTWTATLFYDTPANAIGSYTTPTLAEAGNWTTYTSPNIAATPASVGGKLGILMASAGGISQMDEITVNVVPEPTAMSLMALAGLGLLLKRRN